MSCRHGRGGLTGDIGLLPPLHQHQAPSCSPCHTPCAGAGLSRAEQGRKPSRLLLRFTSHACRLCRLPSEGSLDPACFDCLAGG